MIFPALVALPKLLPEGNHVSLVGQNENSWGWRFAGE